LTTRHPGWEEFVDRLSGPDGIEWRNDGTDSTWTCDGTLAAAERVLTPRQPLDGRQGPRGARAPR
jgi:hypothetical protein